MATPCRVGLGQSDLFDIRHNSDGKNLGVIRTEVGTGGYNKS